MARLVTLHDTDGEIIYPQTISNMDYSTSEQDTGCKWIDGKPIYKKTIDFGSLTDNTGKSVAHGITSINRVVKIEAIMYQGANSWAIPYTSVISVSVEGSNVAIYTNTNLTRFSAFVTVYYTKTTD